MSPSSTLSSTTTTKEWIKHGRVSGFDRGEFYVDREGNIR
jgi:hypothetical protein